MITQWDYDALGRLISESFDSGADGTVDRIDSYEFDLASNRKTKKVDANADDDYNDPGDSETTYVYDVKDRLLSETLDAPGTDDDRHTVYEYGRDPGSARYLKTQQTAKTVYAGTDDTGTLIDRTDYTYNRQGRLAKVETTAAGDNPEYVEEYEYNADGIRVKKTVTQDADSNASLNGETPQTTLYLIDPKNHTGYAQILEEFDAATQAFLRYTLGHDVVSQTDLVAATTLFLLYDGHGSTRGLVDATGAPIANQVFRYDAYGNRMDDSIAVTSLLYSGEKTDLTGLQYLRARYYDPNVGRFNRLDPFDGDVNDPVSLHKYLYTHANPVMGVDPSGKFAMGLVGTMAVTTTLGAGIGYYYGGWKGAIWGSIGGAIFGAGLGYGFAIGGLAEASFGIKASIGSLMGLGLCTGLGGIYWSGINNWNIERPKTPRRIVFVTGDLDEARVHAAEMAAQGYSPGIVGGALAKAGHVVSFLHNPTEARFIDAANKNDIMVVFAHGAGASEGFAHGRYVGWDKRPFAAFKLGGVSTNSVDDLGAWVGMSGYGNCKHINEKWITANEIEEARIKGKLRNRKLIVAAASCRAAQTARLREAFGWCGFVGPNQDIGAGEAMDVFDFVVNYASSDNPESVAQACQAYVNANRAVNVVNPQDCYYSE